MAMKRKIAALVVFVAIAVMSISGTMAYFTADSIATNVITSGNISIDLIEQELTDDGELVPFKDKKGVMPGDEISKIVTVRNTSTSEAAYIRIAVDKVIILKSGDKDEAGKQLITCNINEKDWELKADGYYYYKHQLAAGETTKPLFETVTFSGEMGNKYKNCKTTIEVKAEAVQVKNNGATVFEAAGWNSNQTSDDEQ